MAGIIGQVASRLPVRNAQWASSRVGVVGWTDHELKGTVIMLEEGCEYVQLEDAALPVMAENTVNVRIFADERG